jgi:hypothetical protein
MLKNTVELFVFTNFTPNGGRLSVCIHNTKPLFLKYAQQNIFLVVHFVPAKTPHSLAIWYRTGDENSISSECQSKHWKRHRHLCKLLRETYTVEIQMIDTVSVMDFVPNIVGIRQFDNF